jgi:hypothetical protein
MKYIENPTLSLSFSTPIMVGGAQYAGVLKWELGDANGVYVEVDPVNGSGVAAANAAIDPSNPQVLLVDRVAVGIDFYVRASYPGIVGPCSRPSVTDKFQFVAPSVWINPFCVDVQ